MAKHNPTLYTHICISCSQAQITSKRKRKSNMCYACSRKKGISDVERFWSYVDKDVACQCHSWDDRCWIWTGRCDQESGYGVFAVNQRPMSAHRFIYQEEHGILPSHIYVLHKPPCILRHCIRHLYEGTPKQNTQDALMMQRFPTGEAHAVLHGYYQNLPHGDDHWTRKEPEKMLYGDDHWTHRKPEKMAFGDSHWTHKQPEKLYRGEEHAQIHNGYVNLPRGKEHAQRHNGYINHARGEKHPNALLTESDVLAIRAEHATGMSIGALAKKYAKDKKTVWYIVTRRSWKHI